MRLPRTVAVVSVLVWMVDSASGDSQGPQASRGHRGVYAEAIVRW